MERITKINRSSYGNKIDTEDYSVYELMQTVLSKLAAYEDTNLMPDEVEELQGRISHLQGFYDYMNELYGTGLEVANWHLNGDLKSFDDFFDSAEKMN